MKKSIFLLVAVFMVLQGFSQMGGPNSTCENAAPFCTGTLYQFPAGVNAGNGQPGPFYSCLTTRPNPAWYYMKVANPGLIKIEMHSEPARDIDFCCWGPFTSQFACTELTQNKVVDCSYSPNASETCDIPNTLTGQYYILVITNYSNQPCNIIFSQVGGTGTTDCSILPPPCSNNSPICAGQTLQLTANTVSGATYAWSGPNGFHSNIQNPTIPNAQPVNAGNYYLNITINGQPSQDSSVTHVDVYQLAANAGNDTSITNGVFTVLHGSASGGSGAYHYHWSDTSFFVDPNVKDPTTVNLFAAHLFTLKVTDDTAGCINEDEVLVSIVGGPLAVGATANPSGICFGENTQLNAVGSGGTGTYTYSWTGPNGFTSTIQNPVVQPSVTSTYNVSVFDGYNTTNGSVTVMVVPLPIANAGVNISIPYGWYTYLSGSGQGTGNFAYLWSPAEKLVNPDVASPRTVPLEASTLFSLVITDQTTHCVSLPSNMTVEIAGGPLTANPNPADDSICIGATTQLFACGGGGSGNYTYEWSSNPAGFTSTEPNPMVSPVVTTSYSVDIFDGQNHSYGNTHVVLYPQPVIHLGPVDSTVCLYNIVTLDAGNPGAEYLWSNGQTTRSIDVTASGLSTEVQTYNVKVTNIHGCFTESYINVIFDFAACVGVDELGNSYSLKIYPNPTYGQLYVESSGLQKELKMEIQTIYGNRMYTGVIPASNDQQVTSFDLSSLPKGLYFIITGDKVKQTEKLIIR